MEDSLIFFGTKQVDNTNTNASMMWKINEQSTLCDTSVIYSVSYLW